ncbi:GntR family transcriptional regulator [Fusibacter bizertensis]
MKIDFNSEKPIYLQIMEEIEEAIFIGIFKEEAQIPSTTEISAGLKINPATVLKGMNLLVEQGLIYKKRGLGMFVSTGAKALITLKRKNDFYEHFIYPMLKEAEKLDIEVSDILLQIERRQQQ